MERLTRRSANGTGVYATPSILTIENVLSVSGRKKGKFLW